MTLVDILQIILFVMALMIFHESGHVISAKIMGLDIQKISFQLKPYPHFFVAIEWPRMEKQRLIYLFSGSSVTVTLFIVAFLFHFFGIKNLYYAFVVQLVLESNPFYSDITIAAVTKTKFDYTNKETTLSDRSQTLMKNSAHGSFVADKKTNYAHEKSYADLYQEQFSNYQFSYKWYIHFTAWIALILFSIKYNHLFT